MLELIAAWVLFPALAGTVCLGLGLAADRMAGGGVPGVLLLPLGLAALIAVAQTITFADPLAELVTPAVVLLALGGLWLGRARLAPLRPDRWAGAAGLGVLAVYAAPIVLSGSATFAGYTLLGDNAIHFILADWVGEHGPHKAELAPSSYQASLDAYLETAYPLGAHAALAALAPLGFQDLAWLYQPYLALLAVATGLGLYGLLRGAIRSHALRALAAFIGAQPALMYGYALQGSVKELCVAALLVLLAALVAWLWHEGATVRRTLVLALPVAAGLGVLNLAIAPYFGPLLLAAGLVVLGRRTMSWRDRLLGAGASAALALVLALPMLVTSRDFVDVANVSLTSGEEMGNLLRPLSMVQALGIWPRGDYRLDLADHRSLAYVLMGVVALSAVFGLVFLLRRFAAGPLLLVGAALIGSAYAINRGSPWADGKALMIASPAVMAAAFVGMESLRRAGRGTEALLVAVAVAGGVLWSNALAYSWADLAPRERLEELADVEDRLGGAGPSLYTDFEEFAKYFMRESAPTGATDSWQPEPRATLPSGAATPFGFGIELDQIDPGFVRRFPVLVLRRSPGGSRPPADYEHAFSTGSYDVWLRGDGPEVVEHYGIGGTITGRSGPDCNRLEEVAEAAEEEGGELAYVPVAPLPAFIPAQQRQLPPGWAVDGADALVLRPHEAGTVTGEIAVGAGGRYEVWLEGSFSRPVAVRIDGREVGTVRQRLSPRGGYEPVGEIELPAGRHEVEVVRPEGGLAPGDDGGNRLIGALVLRPVSAEQEVERIAAERWPDICGDLLDWVEAVR